jgi:hypothetical protein
MLAMASQPVKTPPGQQRPKAITQQRMRPPPAAPSHGSYPPRFEAPPSFEESFEAPPPLPPCPCCSRRAAAVKVVRHGEQCSECAYVIWERD